ncbi:hypothetical protein BC936DRAFT_141643, partial [Jimgerdemannia flammicorona]
MEAVQADLQNRGWFLSESGIARLKDGIEKEEPSVDDLTDLRQIASSKLPQDIQSLSCVPSPLVLQLQQVLNLSAPTQHQVERPKLLQLSLTDGKKKLKTVEILGELEDV